MKWLYLKLNLAVTRTRTIKRSLSFSSDMEKQYFTSSSAFREGTFFLGGGGGERAGEF